MNSSININNGQESICRMIHSAIIPFCLCWRIGRIQFVINTNKCREWKFYGKVDILFGNIYLTNRDEIGIFIKKKFQSQGFGSDALKKFLQKTGKKRFLANINPTNYKSIQFFGKNGFSHITSTYQIKFD